MTQQPHTAPRKIVAGHSTTMVTSVDTAQPLTAWLAGQAAEHGLRWLLLHADSGVIWGELRGDDLALSVPDTMLDWNSLHQARLFSKQGELFVWQGPQGLQARLIHDGSGKATEWIDEQQVLWGDRIDHSSSANPGFTPIVEGSQGIVHAPPIGDLLPTDTRRARLQVRHYLGEDDSGVVRLIDSRLVKLVKPGDER